MKMLIQGIKTIMVVLGMMMLTVFTTDVSQAREMEMERKDFNPLQSGEIQGLGKKGGGGTPAPPADPHCANGSVGPVEHSTVSRACKVNGQDGVKTCYHKMVKCLSGPGEEEYAHSENCGPCVALPTQPGQTQTPTGR
ncbi:MAG: hypothetical protein OEW33_13665 [Nitrospirota bacterium]|nr:hypothetical protein [Nitrospirota bacterium]MDH4361768.1 hypothetical protein [Nitrospirota bacterium]